MPSTARRTFPDIEQIRRLPLLLRMQIPPEWEDRNGHVNVQFFTTLYELGSWNIMHGKGFDQEWFKDRSVSIFDHEHHLNFLSEIRVGDPVSTFHRIVGLSEKRMHGLYFIVNDQYDRLAGVLEYVCSHIDMTRRRSTPFLPDMMQALQNEFAQHRDLDWDAPVCGVMAA